MTKNYGPFLEWSGQHTEKDGWGPVNATNKFIFVHIQKTAGVSIASSLDMTCWHCHDEAYRIKTILNQSLFGQKIWKEYFKFSFVRNPWSWVISSLIFHAQIYKVQLDVHAFLKQWMSQGEIKDVNIFTNSIQYLNKSQYSFLSDNNLDEGKILVDFVGRFENLQQDFDYICDKITIPRRKVPHYNATENYGHYSDYYDQATKKFIATKYAKDIEYFGYKFDT